MTGTAIDDTRTGPGRDELDLEKVTELEQFDPERMDGVNGPANGYPPLMLKALADPHAPAPAAADTSSTQEGHIATATTDPIPADATQDEAGPPEPVTKSEAAGDLETVAVELPADASVSIKPTDLANLLALKKRLAAEQSEGRTAKRDFDPNTGGGVDRDKIPTEDFADPEHRAFPIVVPKDVADVGPNLNRPNLKGDPEKIKARAIAIARRKGPKFEAQIPDSWTDGGKSDAKKAKGNGKKPFPGAAPAFDGKDSDHDGVDADAPGSERDDETRKPPKVKPGSARKGAKDCPGCGKTYHADSKQRTCEDCGHDLPAAAKGAAVTKGDDVMCLGCGHELDDEHRFCPNCGKPNPQHAETAKARKACKGCGGPMAKGAKFCPACGAPGKTAKGKDPSPQDAAVSDAIDRLKDDAKAALAAQERDPDAETHPADTAVTAHLQDAEDAIDAAQDAQEDDIDSDDERAHEEAATAAKGADTPAYHLARLHDATCAAYHLGDVIGAHPLAAKGLAALADPAPFAAQVTAALTEDAGTGSRAAELPGLSAAYHAAVAMKAAAAHDGLLDDAMAALRKAFADYYPNAHPKPGSITPGQFHRPYVTGGRANQAAKPGQKPRVPLAAHVPDPDDFRRPLITAGREAASPGSKPSGVGKNRMYYSNDGKDQAATVLAAMHDWIADNHPTICPMKGVPYDNEPGVDVNSMASTLTSAQPTPQRMSATRASGGGPAPVTAGHAASVVTPGPTRKNKAAKDAAKEERRMAKAARIAQEAAATAAHTPVLDAELLKNALRDIVAEQLGDLKTTLGEHEARIAAWESAPDPAQMAPRNGAAALGKARETSHEVPAGGDRPSEQRLMRLMKQTLDPDSGVRVAAIGELTGLVGREAAAELLAAAH